MRTGSKQRRRKTPVSSANLTTTKNIAPLVPFLKYEIGDHVILRRKNGNFRDIIGEVKQFIVKTSPAGAGTGSLLLGVEFGFGGTKVSCMIALHPHEVRLA